MKADPQAEADAAARQISTLIDGKAYTVPSVLTPVEFERTVAAIILATVTRCMPTPSEGLGR